jgi:hypothetical protein
MKTSTAIAFTLVVLVSLVAAAEQPTLTGMSATMTTDPDQAKPSDQATISDQVVSSLLRGSRSASLFIPVGVVTNKATATGNNVVVSTSKIVVSKGDRVALAGTVDESDESTKSAPSVVVPVGIVSNKLAVNGNNILVTKSTILVSKNDRVQLAKIIKEMKPG